MQYIFNQFLKMQHVSWVWEDAVVIPFPTIISPKTYNDFRRLTLTWIVMKTFEKLVNSEILKNTEHDLDPIKLAYRRTRGVEDITATLLNRLFKHLEGKGTHARLLICFEHSPSPCFNPEAPRVF